VSRVRRPALLPMILVAMMVASPLAVTAEAAAIPRRADLLKAGYLLNFVKFTEWPPSVSQNTLLICVMGASGLHAALTHDAGERHVGARKIELREVTQPSAIEGCSVLYVDANLPAGEATSVSAAARSAPMLTVSDRKDFVRQGGVIGVFTEDNRLRFNVNVENAKRAGLRISSALLELASGVERDAS
jgi:hypothetical protein